MSKKLRQRSLNSWIRVQKAPTRSVHPTKTRFRDLPKGEEASVKFLQERGLLPSNRSCTNAHPMKPYFGTSVFWKCNVKACQEKINMRRDNWFQDTRLPFESIICFLYSYAFELTSIKWCERELGICKEAAIDYNSHMRQICHEVLWRSTGIIGGKGLIVEIDESAYTHRKDAATLEELIARRIHPESIIISDLWKGYNGLQRNQLTLSHLTVNHKKNFVDPETGAHTNTVERMWRSSKKRNKNQSGTARHHLVSYLEEFWWRNRIKEKDPFIELLCDIARLYPPNVPFEVAR